MGRNPFHKIKFSYKLIGAFFVIASLSGVVGLFGIMQLNTLDTTITEFAEINVEQAELSLQTIIIMQKELLLMYDAILRCQSQDPGERLTRIFGISTGEDPLAEFENANQLMLEGFSKLAVLLEGTDQEAILEPLQQDYESFATILLGPSGAFAALTEYQKWNAMVMTQSALLSPLMEELDGKFQDLKGCVSSKEVGWYNATVLEDVNALNLLAWRAYQIVSKYLTTPQIASAEAIAERLELQRRFIDDSAYANQDTATSGVEWEFMERLAQTEENVATAGSSIDQITTERLLFEIRNLFMFNAQRTEIREYESFASIVRRLEDGIFRSYSIAANSWSAAQSVMETAMYMGGTLMAQLEKLNEWVKQQMAMAKTNASANVARTTVITLIVAIAASGLGLLLGVLFSRSVVSPLSKIAKASEIIAQGDLTVKLDHTTQKDEIGILQSSFIAMTEFLTPAVFQISSIAAELHSAAQDMSSRAEEVNASSEEITSITQQLASGAAKQATQIDRALNRAEELQTLFEEKIQGIEVTSELIADIANQVNILALNASIEAARAGDYGRGFAVVADNVRRLANDTKQALVEINETIANIRTALKTSIDVIATSVQETASVAQETAASSEEASAAVEEQTATIEEITAASQELALAATNLEEVTKQFKLL